MPAAMARQTPPAVHRLPGTREDGRPTRNNGVRLRPQGEGQAMRRICRRLTGSLGLCAVLTTVVVGTTPAPAVTVAANAAADNVIATGAGFDNSNFGSAASFEAGYEWAYGYWGRSLVRFDVSAIPVGSQINSIDLLLHSTFVVGTGNPGDKNLEVYALSAPWDELQSTWNSRLTATPWSVPGGDYGTLLGQFDWSGLAVTGASPGAANDLLMVSILPGAGSQAARDSLIGAWLGGTNYGFLLKNGTEAAAVSLGIRSREDATPTNRPVLLIDYTIPEPAALVLLLCGGGLIALRRRPAGETTGE